jgi:hypothetical protein
MRRSVILAVLLTTAGASLFLHAAEPAPKPWRLHEALELPDWLDLSGEQRTRYETLGNQFRAGRTGGDQALTLRTSVIGQVKTDPAGALVEMLDARQYLSDSGTPIDNTMVNPLEVLQAYVRLNAHDLIPGGTNTVKIGRETLDLGNRRLMARNAFRNTINSFTGIDWLWSAEKGGSIRAFYFLPVRRLPEDATSLLDNEIVADTQSFAQQFWGVYATSRKLAYDIRAEAYWFDLYESAAATSRRRRLHTPGVRVFKNPVPDHWDFEVEAALQRGSSRTGAGSLPALDHTAYLVHGGLGYTFLAPWTPRIGIRYDQASGDGNPNDRENNRFDTLFGARRWEFGPTSIYGAIARSNLRSPDYMISAKPTKNLELSVTHRFIWLDSARDAFTAAGVRDASGGSGTFVGQQVETRMRWEAIPGNLRFDTGFVWLADGEFLKNAPNATRQGDTTFAYFEATLTF